MNRFLSFLAGTLAAGWLALAPTPARAAVDEADLLPIDEAFALQARATDRGRIEFTWTIADGYYLYRHRTKVSTIDSSFKTNPLQMPDGAKHTDEFFGEVETYRGALTAVQTGAAATGVEAVTFRVGYQGCADVGRGHLRPVPVQVIAVGDRPRELDSAAFRRARLQREGLVDRQQVGLVDGRAHGGRRQREPAGGDRAGEKGEETVHASGIRVCAWIHCR